MVQIQDIVAFKSMTILHLDIKNECNLMQRVNKMSLKSLLMFIPVLYPLRRDGTMAVEIDTVVSNIQWSSSLWHEKPLDKWDL